MMRPQPLLLFVLFLNACNPGDELPDGGPLGDAGDAATLSDGANDTLQGMTDASPPPDDVVAWDGDVPPDDGLPPTISNFRVVDDARDRVYFDSSKPIQATDASGFTISTSTIAEVVVVPNAPTGHYFRLTEALDFWDNNTLRYEGGSDLSDLSERPLIEFTLSYIQNRIPEPSTTMDRYVTSNATGGGDGMSEASAWTLEEAMGYAEYTAPGSYTDFVGQAEAGMTVWVKAGDYGARNLACRREGTASNPIKFIGYRDAIGDITSNYFDYGVEWDPSEMPTLTGTRSASGNAIQLTGSHYVVFRNIQITNYAHTVRINGSINSHIILEHINLRDNGEGMSFTTGDSDRPNHFYSNDHMRILNSVSINIENYHGIAMYGDGSGLIDNFKSYDDVGDQDYGISINGHNNIVRNSHVEQFNTASDNHSRHGIGVRGEWNNSNTYNLIELCTVSNVMEAFYIRNFGSDFNVIKDCEYHSNDNGVNYVSTRGTGVIAIYGGGNNNIFERIKGYESTFGIILRDDAYENDHPDDDIGHNNIVRNCSFDRVVYAVHVSGDPTSEVHNTEIVNSTFNDGYYIVLEDDPVDIQELNFRNCLFTDFIGDPQVMEPNSEISFTHSNFFGNRDNWLSPGEGNTNLDPSYQGLEDLRLTGDSPPEITQGGEVLEAAAYDIEGNKRTPPYSMGAYEYDE